MTRRLPKTGPAECFAFRRRGQAAFPAGACLLPEDGCAFRRPANSVLRDGGASDFAMAKSEDAQFVGRPPKLQ